jgi:hypothetical protein
MMKKYATTYLMSISVLSAVQFWSFRRMTPWKLSANEQSSFGVLDDHTLLKDTKNVHAVQRSLGGELGASKQSLSTHTHLFFNAYIPEKEERADTPNEVSGTAAWRIISEQLEQIGKSYVAQQGATVHFTIVGSNDAYGAGINKFCNSLANGKVKCVVSGHFPGNGGELDTLQYLYSHCRAPENRHSRVVYMHNKGSYHPSPRNEKLRRAMTDAVTHQMCLEPEDDTCNVCGLIFTAPPRMYAPVMPGNFFTASCEYVNKLFPPSIFRRRMRKLSGRAKQLISDGRFHFRNKKEANKPWVMGNNRYAAEHWIGTHPDVRPCDLSTTPNYWYWENHDHSMNEFAWAMYPRNHQNFSNHTESESYINADLRLLAYTLLPGLLWRFSHLYHQLPQEDSWIYKLQDGSFWKDAVQKHGHKAVDLITSPEFDRNEAMQTFQLQQTN